MTVKNTAREKFEEAAQLFAEAITLRDYAERCFKEAVEGLEEASVLKQRTARDYSLANSNLQHAARALFDENHTTPDECAAQGEVKECVSNKALKQQYDGGQVGHWSVP